MGPPPPSRVAKAIWTDVRGPIAAAAVSLARFGWTFTGPFELTDAQGTEHTLTTASPAMVRDLLREAVRVAFERKVGSKFATQDESFIDRRACLDLAIAASRPCRNVTRQQAAVFRAAACGAIWTATIAKD